MKTNKCDFCNKILNYKPLRIVIQKYGAGKYKQYYQVKRFDICQLCLEKVCKLFSKDSNK